jgi:hypothetical protein
MPAELGLESEPGTRREKAPTGGTHPSAREKGKGGPGVRASWAGRSWASWKKKEWATGLCSEERKEEEVGPAGLGCKGEKREEKEKERVGRAQLKKERAKELHSNAFEFEFEI